jgi:hypothetical protein
MSVPENPSLQSGAQATPPLELLALELELEVELAALEAEAEEACAVEELDEVVDVEAPPAPPLEAEEAATAPAPPAPPPEVDEVEEAELEVTATEEAPPAPPLLLLLLLPTGAPPAPPGFPVVVPPPEEPQAATRAMTEPSDPGSKGVIRIAEGYPRAGPPAARCPARSSDGSWTKRVARPRRIDSGQGAASPGRGGSALNPPDAER